MFIFVFDVCKCGKCCVLFSSSKNPPLKGQKNDLECGFIRLSEGVTVTHNETHPPMLCTVGAGHWRESRNPRWVYRGGEDERSVVEAAVRGGRGRGRVPHRNGSTGQDEGVHAGVFEHLWKLKVRPLCYVFNSLTSKLRQICGVFLYYVVYF